MEVIKQLLWERKLVGLEFCNNFRTAYPKCSSGDFRRDVDKMEDAFSDGMEFQILGKPLDWDNPLYLFRFYGAFDEFDPMSV